MQSNLLSSFELEAILRTALRMPLMLLSAVVLTMNSAISPKVGMML